MTAGFPLDPNAASSTFFDDQLPELSDARIAGQRELVIEQPPDNNGVTSLTFTYEILADGSGEIAFTLVGNLVPGPTIETLLINAEWLPTGAGKATLAVVSGDGSG